MAPLIEVRRAIEIGAAARRLAKAVDRRLRVEQGPLDQGALHPGVRPFVVGDGDTAVGAAQDRLDDHRVAEGLDVTLALQLGLVGVDAARDVDGHGQRQVDLLPLLCGGRPGKQEQKDAETEQHGHGDLRIRCTRRGKKCTARRKPMSAALWTARGAGR